MYTPKQFSVDADSAAEFLSQIQAADLVTVTEEGLLATFLPLLFVPEAGEHGALRGHLARKNDQWQRAGVGEALVIVHGEDAYIIRAGIRRRPSTGGSCRRGTTRPLTSTGELVIHDEPEWVDENVRRLTARQESRRAHPWSVDDAPPAFHEGQLRAIVGVELLICRVEAKFKMSQNQKDDNIDGVIAGLAGDGRGTSLRSFSASAQTRRSRASALPSSPTRIWIWGWASSKV